MIYLLDTNICIYALKKQPQQIFQILLKKSTQDIYISTVTIAELEYGISKSQFPERNQNALYDFLKPFNIAKFDELAARHYGQIRLKLEKAGQIIGGMDLLIASQALSLNATLVTNNLREFKRVKGLKIENWI